jgi:hypothetical protein
VLNRFNSIFEKPSEGTASRENLIKQNKKNKTQRRIHKYFFSHYFCFIFFRKSSPEGMRQPTIHQMRKKNHRGKVKEVEKFQYLLEMPTFAFSKTFRGFS